VAFIVVGMTDAMELSLLDGNTVQKYVHSDPDEIAKLRDIKGLYKCIPQEDVRLHTKKEIYSKERTTGPDIGQIFYFLNPGQKHDVPRIKSFEGNPYLAGHENDKKEEVFAPLILGCLQEASVENAEKQEDRAIADRQKKALRKMQLSFLLQPKEENNSQKRTFAQATSTDKKDGDLSEESVVSNTSKRATKKRSTVSEKMKICGINGCRFSTILSDTMRRHKERPHEQKQCPYPGCAVHYQSKADFSQHIDDAHPEICCTICCYETSTRSYLLQHFRSAKHRKNLASIKFGEGQIV
jgi:hypothetical protein